MERLTEVSNNRYSLKQTANDLCSKECEEHEHCRDCPVYASWIKLSAYEDTELSPECVMKLAKAREQGRLMELHYPIGTLMYRIIEKKCNNYEDCYINSCGADLSKCEFGYKPSWNIEETVFTLHALDRVGKSVFLTYDEAITVLKKLESIV